MQTNSSNLLTNPLLCKELLLGWMLQSYHHTASCLTISELSDKEWELIISQSQQIGLNSRIIEILNTSKTSGIIPPQILASLTTARIMAIQRNLMLLDEYRTISVKLNLDNIPHQAIKGLWILQQAELLGMSRITSDIDLLIPPEEIEHAVSVIRKLGYKQNPAKSKFDIPINIKAGHHLIPFRRNGVSLEIHYKALPGSSEVFNSELVHQSRTRDHFSVILLHFVRHTITGDPQIKWLADILRLFQHLKPEDYPFINSTIYHDQHSDTALKLMDILIKWENSIVPINQANSLANLLVKPDYQPCNNLKKTARNLPKGIDGIRYICATVFPRREYLRFIYHSAQKYPVILLYPFHWHQLGQKLGLMTLRSLKVF